MSYFRRLNYSLGDEDSSLDLALVANPGGRLAVVAGSGARVVALLASSPELLSCVDTSQVQLALTRLRVETLRKMPLEQYAAFWGYPAEPMTSDERMRLVLALPIPDIERSLLIPIFEANGWSEPIYYGRFERMMGRLAWLNRLLTGALGPELLAARTVGEQCRLFESARFGSRWRLLVRLLANSVVLDAALYGGEFPKRTVPGSMYSNFLDIYARLFAQVQMRDTFFGQLSFFGRLSDRPAGMSEVEPEIYAAARRSVETTKVEYVVGDVLNIVGDRRDEFDFVSLSDVPSFLPASSAGGYLQAVRPGLRPDALVVARGNMRVVEPEEDGFDRVGGACFDELCRAECTQLWQIRAHRLI